MFMLEKTAWLIMKGMIQNGQKLSLVLIQGEDLAGVECCSEKQNPLANLEDIKGHIQHTCGYEPTDANDRRLFYKIKEKIDGKEKLLYCLEISTAVIFI